MKLTDGEKLILVMLCDLYGKREIDPDFVRRMICNDETWALRWKYPGIPFEPEPTPALVKEVSDILDMWSFVESSYNGLDPAEKKQVKDAAGFHGDKPEFLGFDGNNETEHLGVARVLINDLGRWTDLKGRGDCNSHFPAVDLHRRMLSVFTPMRSAMSSGRLTVKQLIEVLTARAERSAA